MAFDEILEKIKAADMVLVGLGEEFNDTAFLKSKEGYQKGRNIIEESRQLWLLPAYDVWYRKKMPERKAEIQEALQNLVNLLQEKNYFVVSTSVNDRIDDISWKHGRLVKPCGGSRKKQCADCCGEGLHDLSEEDKDALAVYFEKIVESDGNETDAENINLQTCPQCGKPFVLNNIYSEKYDENGYLPQWQLYKKWLQGTLNKKIVILELGVGMKFPSVIRWPFEKIAFFNRKADFYRVNANLYQMSEELKEKGVSIPKNAIDWLRGM